MYSFNPITGEDSGNGLILLDYKMKQLTLLAESKSDFIKGILIMDLNGKLNVYPDYVKENVWKLNIPVDDVFNAIFLG